MIFALFKKNSEMQKSGKLKENERKRNDDKNNSIKNDEEEIEKFLGRLELQRKLLINFVVADALDNNSDVAEL
ncbi:MAG: hypothetical protein FD166_3515 [Bacteroidetes bacterium]|nr:MAG: hypothetical protein FD166_3515 [Bacteroidota bacterium]